MKKTILIAIAAAAGLAGCSIAPASAATIGIAAKAAMPYQSIPTVSAHGKVVVSDFTPAREHRLVSDAEAVAFDGHIGKVEASCGGKKIAITRADEAEPLPALNAQIYKVCPGRDLTVTITTTN